MSMQPHPLMRTLRIALLTTVISSSSVMAADTTSQEMINTRQETQIWTTYALSPYLRANDLKVSVKNGKARLSGIVDEEVNKDLARQIALGVNGIKEVDNQIIVQADYVIPMHQPATRSYGEVVDDATITATIKSKLMWNKHTDGLAIDVDTKYGKVTLLGHADSGITKDLASRLAMNTRGVVSVNNQLTIKNQKSTLAHKTKNSAYHAEQQVSDSWITAKVKSTLLYSNNVSGLNIVVNTHNGIVTLNGKVNNGSERSLAIELARNVRGVKDVYAKELTF